MRFVTGAVRSPSLRGGVVAVGMLLLAAAPAAAQCDTGYWMPGVALPYVGGSPRIMAPCANGDLLATGSMGEMSSAIDSMVSWRYEPATNIWRAVGSGLNAALPSLLTGGVAELPNGDVIIAANFQDRTGGAITYRYAAASVNWAPDSVTSSGTVLAKGVLTLPGGDVVMGGSFVDLNGVPVAGLARLASGAAPGAWQALTPALSNGAGTVSVTSLSLTPAGDLIVSGQFTSAGAVPAVGIAVYHPATSTWSALGAGFPGTSGGGIAVTRMLPSGDVLAGGTFTTGSGAPATRLARYSAATGQWSAFGDTFNAAVFAFAVLPSGDIVAGRTFSLCGTATTHGIARFSQATQAWSQLGGGLITVQGVNNLNGSARALALLSDGSLAVAGVFNRAGTTVTNNFSRFVFGGGTLAITGQPQNAATCPGGQASFTAAGPVGSSYQWQVETSGLGGAAWVNLANHAGPDGTVSGVTGATLSLSGLTQRPPLRVRCLVSDACGSATSNMASLTFDAPGCPGACGSSDFDGDGDIGTDADIEAFFRVLAGGHC